jgi:hypothetical protein
MPIVVERRTHTPKRSYSVRFQESQTFVVDDLHALGKWGLVSRVLQRFLQIVDNLEKRKYDLALAILSMFVAVTLTAATIVLEVRKRTKVALPLIAEIVSQ